MDCRVAIPSLAPIFLLALAVLLTPRLSPSLRLRFLARLPFAKSSSAASWSGTNSKRSSAHASSPGLFSLLLLHLHRISSPVSISTTSLFSDTQESSLDCLWFRFLARSLHSRYTHRFRSFIAPSTSLTVLSSQRHDSDHRSRAFIGLGPHERVLKPFALTVIDLRVSSLCHLFALTQAGIDE